MHILREEGGTCPPHSPLNRNSNFLGGAFPPFPLDHYLERTYFKPFSIIILTRALCKLFRCHLNIHIIYHLMHLVD